MVRLGLKLWWLGTLGILCALPGTGSSAAFKPAQSSEQAGAPSQPAQTSAAQSSSASEAKSSDSEAQGTAKQGSPTHKTPAASKTPSTKKPATGTATGTTKKPAARTTTAAHRKRPLSPRVRRMRQAFTASASLRPMARQLMQDRTAAAYAGVESYARAHAKEDAGALAWLVIGYARILDRDYARAIDPLNHAKLHAGDLGDYVDYYLGTAYSQTNHTAEALVALANFATTHPDPLLVRDAHLSYANALISEGRAAEAAAILEKDRLPARSDIELAVGRAYAAAGENQKAAEAFSNIYYNMPASAEADAANSEMRRLSSLTPATATQKRTRADLLLKARRYNDAADVYRDLINGASPAERVPIQLALADALHRGGRNREARQVVGSLPSVSAEQNAQRLFILGEIDWAESDNTAYYGTVDALRQNTPTSGWFEQALLSTANLHLVHHEYDQSLDAFRELQQRFPNGARASYAHWKAAWLTLRQGRNEEAKKAFEEQIALYPNGGEVPNALYWRARLAEEDNQPAMARAFYEKLSQRYKNYYYAELGRQRLRKLPAASTDVAEHYALLDRVPPLDSSTKIALTDPPSDDLHLQKAELLSNGGLIDFAVREVQAAATASGGNWGPSETAQLYIENGMYDRAIEVMKRSTPSYFALDIPDLPRAYWEALFPKPYWADLKRFSTNNELDPYLVASLIRQESEFNPVAVSRANAVGLMQLLPKTGKNVARQEKLKRYNPSELYTPTVNLQLGTRYFRGMVDKFGGSFEYALAAYNAGSDRVEEWLGQGTYRDPQEFVESIPFTETREYVQAILRNASVYKQLYGTP